MKIKIGRKEFIDIINTIQEQINHDNKCSEYFQIILPETYIVT